MAAGDAKKFVEALEADQKLMEQIRAKAAEVGSAIEAYVAAAKEAGYEITAEELEAVLKARQKAGIAAVDGAELNDAELDQVAGGGGWCWTSDKCMKIINYEKKYSNCQVTYNPSEILNCEVLDYCYALVWNY